MEGNSWPGNVPVMLDCRMYNEALPFPSLPCLHPVFIDH